VVCVSPKRGKALSGHHLCTRVTIVIPIICGAVSGEEGEGILYKKISRIVPEAIRLNL